MVWKAADGAGPNPNPSVQPFFFSLKIFILFLFIQAFSCSFFSPTSLLLLFSLFWVLTQRKARQQQRNRTFIEWFGFSWMERSFPFRAGRGMMLPALSQCP